MSQKLALIGAGAMGGAIGTRLLETGNELAVFDLDKEKVAAFGRQRRAGGCERRGCGMLAQKP